MQSMNHDQCFFLRLNRKNFQFFYGWGKFEKVLNRKNFQKKIGLGKVKRCFLPQTLLNLNVFVMEKCYFQVKAFPKISKFSRRLTAAENTYLYCLIMKFPCL